MGKIIDAHVHLPADGSVTVQQLLQFMDTHHVEKAVLLQNPTVGIINDLVQESITHHPDRLAGVIQVDPLDATAVDRIAQYSKTPGMHSVKFEMSEQWGWSGIHSGLQMDKGPFVEIWDSVAQHGLKGIIDTGPIHNPGYQVDALDGITTTYSSIPFVIEHLGYLTNDLVHDSRALAKSICDRLRGIK